jgi:hypothetical protein
MVNKNVNKKVYYIEPQGMDLDLQHFVLFVKMKKHITKVTIFKNYISLAFSGTSFAMHISNLWRTHSNAYLFNLRRQK